jgi:hypothetical protein
MLSADSNCKTLLLRDDFNSFFGRLIVWVDLIDEAIYYYKRITKSFNFSEVVSV